MLHGDVLGERARLTPEHTALVDVASGRRFTYAELDSRASACARLLREDLGLGRGDRYGLLAGNRPEYLEIVFAAAKAGLVLVPLSTRATPHELEHVVRDSGLRVLFHDQAQAATADSLRDLSPIESVVALGSPRRPGDLGYGDRIAAGGGFREHCDPEDLLFLLYTSGTTGKPKGVRIPHRMVAWNGYNTVACWGLREDDVSPIFTPLYHAGALGAFLLPLFVVGGTIVLHQGFDPAEVWSTLEKEGCTVVLGVPTIWKLLLEAPQFESVDLSRVRWLISGGAPLPEWIIEAYQRRGVSFKQGYGLTEVGVNCFAMSVSDSVAKKGSIGRPMAFTEARLVDANGAEVALGEVGELCLRGPHVCQGYWHDPEATAAALDSGGFFHTGDLARRDADGFFFIAGRRKDMFISGGVNVYPAEIEAELLLHGSVADAAVIGVPDSTWGEVGCAFVVPRPGHSLDPESLRAHLEPRLSRHKWPRHWRFVESLPRTPYGKVVKPELAQKFESGW